MSYLVRFIGIALLISLSVQGCENNTEDEIYSEEKTIDHGYYENRALQNAFIEELDKAQIPYKVLENDLVRVLTDSLAKYLNLKRKFHSNYFYQMDELDPNYHEQFDINGKFSKCDEKKNKYVKGFKKLDIQHILRKWESGNPDHISCTWTIEYSQIHGPKVDQLRQEIELNE